MKPLRLIAIGLIIVSAIMTGLGGMMDLLSSDFQITRQHAWNDGMYLAVIACALLLLERSM
jgi:hypothetical protein